MGWRRVGGVGRAVPAVASARQARRLAAVCGAARRGGAGLADVGWSLAVDAGGAGATVRWWWRGIGPRFAGGPGRGGGGGAGAGRGAGRGWRRGAGKTVFVFPGQGAQWAGMAAGLLESSPVFAGRLAECAAALAPYVGWSLLEVLREVPGAPALERVDVVQPVSWAVMVSLAAVWRVAGVRPGCGGGSFAGGDRGGVRGGGAVAGGCGAGGGVAEPGDRGGGWRAAAAMVSVALRRRPGGGAAGGGCWGRVWVAAVNGPASVVVAGPGRARWRSWWRGARRRGCGRGGWRWTTPRTPRRSRSCAEELAGLAAGVAPAVPGSRCSRR